MAFEYRLHDVGEGIDAAEIVEWHVSIGDEVREDQPLADVQTDKAVVMIPCPTDGVVLKLGGELGEMVPVGDVLAVFGDRSELEAGEPARGAEGAAEAQPSRESAALAGAPATAPADAGAGQAAADGADGQADGAPRSPAEAATAAAAAAGRPLASPAVRKLARESNVDLGSVTGSGPGGRIVRQDIASAAAAPPPAPGPMAGPERRDETIPLRGTRRAIARNMTQAWQTIPHIVDLREVDATALIAARRDLRARAKADGDEELARVFTMMPLLAKIAATVALRHPGVNSSVDMEREEITRHGAVNLSVAIAAPDGLVTPVVHDADHKSVPTIAREIAGLAESARERRLTPEQLSGGTLTVNNYGSLGSPLSTPIIPPGQATNLGFGRMQDRALVRDGEIVACPVIGLSCSGDHRVLDGADLAAFVNDVVAAIENPILLLGELA
jgi:pyruvate/2-oxoglutarate dehydrogenase complex dihydrolipoamide acyltransferase (E2) component